MPQTSITGHHCTVLLGMATNQLLDCFSSEEPTPQSYRCVNILAAAADIDTESPSLTPSLRQTYEDAPGTAAQVAKTPSLKRLIGAPHHPIPFCLSLSLSLSRVS